MSKQARLILVWVVGIFVTGAVLLRVFSDGEPAPAQAMVERGDVTRSITVSGFLEADNVADLSFPQPTRLTAVLVAEGDYVTAGELLATAGNGALAAERKAAAAAVTQAIASRDELLNGLTLEARAVSSTTVAQAAKALATARTTEANRVAQARANLYSTDLVARSTNITEDATPPVITGSYQCERSGEYLLDVYRSNAESGYSIRVSGLETDTISVSYSQPVALGDCGLSLQFTEGDLYSNSAWIITIPNTNSTTYLARRRAYELAVAQAEQNVTAAEYAYRLASDAATRDTAAPRVEALLAANAAVTSAQAQLERIDAQLGDQIITAPFSGVISNITTRAGETATGVVMSVVATDAFTMVARIPEIDITRIQADQTASIYFDAADQEPVPATVAYVSPTATVIDGVSYYETNLSLQQYPSWLRDGLNADITIAIETERDALRIPTRFITGSDTKTVRLQTETGTATTTIDVRFSGTDGFSVISGLEEGDVVITP